MRQHQSADNQNENKSRLLFAVIISAVLLIVGGSIAVGMIVFNNSHPSVRTETLAAPDEDNHAAYGSAVWDERIDNAARAASTPEIKNQTQGKQDSGDLEPQK